MRSCSSGWAAVIEAITTAAMPTTDCDERAGTADIADSASLTVTDFGGIYRRPHVHSGIRWPQVLFQKQVIAKSLFLDLLTREAGKASHMTVNLSKEPLFEGQTGLSPQNP